MSLNDEGIALALLLADRIGKETLHSHAVGPFPGHGFLARQVEILGEKVMNVGHARELRVFLAPEEPEFVAALPVPDMEQMAAKPRTKIPIREGVFAFGELAIFAARYIELEKFVMNAEIC